MNSAFRSLFYLLLALIGILSPRAEIILGEWTPVFKGVELSISTNIPAAPGERLQVAYALRIDLTDPDVEFFTSPRIETNYIGGNREVAAFTASDFLTRNDLQVAINANFFDNGTYYLPAGTPMDVYGLAVSQGTVVSVTDMARYSASITFDASKFPTMVRSNWPPTLSTDGIHTAVSGNYPVLIDGVNVAPRNNPLDIDPRTVYGISQDRRYLFIVAIDGRQPGYSDGANYFECGQWLLALGASDGMNVDGGGSTCLVFQNTLNQAVRINRSNAVADSGRERTVGSHFGIYAKPLPGFINDVAVAPSDRTASISFTTTLPATSKILYSLSTNLDLTTPLSEFEASEHQVQLTGLLPETKYFFQISALSNGVEQLSSLYAFTTLNFTTTNLVFDITNHWKFFEFSLDGINWTDPEFDDSTWPSGPALLWVDSRSTGPNPDVNPRNTAMPGNPNSFGDPYPTYYFRTHVDLEALQPGSSLLFQCFLDDGAVFYLNGTEIYRLRMSTSDIFYNSLAISFPCADNTETRGDAECLDEFRIPFSALSSARDGDNVLAVEVHNYNIRSNDITFGLALHRIDPIEQSSPAELNVRLIGNSIEIQWDGAGGTLQAAPGPDGPWSDVQAYSGNSVTLEPGATPQFFRLKR
jgi:hypothetical protein